MTMPLEAHILSANVMEFRAHHTHGTPLPDLGIHWDIEYVSVLFEEHPAAVSGTPFSHLPMELIVKIRGL